jgi:ribosome biogenesis protein BMS1
MTDLAKSADLILLLIDGKFGFEMETFEFLNICQVHGFPKIMVPFSPQSLALYTPYIVLYQDTNCSMPSAHSFTATRRFGALAYASLKGLRAQGVLTHLDHFKRVKQLQKTKKRLKSRFWTEIYAGAKLFYLSGLVGDYYQNQEVRAAAPRPPKPAAL